MAVAFYLSQNTSFAMEICKLVFYISSFGLRLEGIFLCVEIDKAKTRLQDKGTGARQGDRCTVLPLNKLINNETLRLRDNLMASVFLCVELNQVMRTTLMCYNYD